MANPVDDKDSEDEVGYSQLEEKNIKGEDLNMRTKCPTAENFNNSEVIQSSFSCAINLSCR